MCSNCCCNSERKRCYQLGIMFTSFYIIVFEIVLAIYAENSMKPEKLKDFILSERPIFDLEISDSQIAGKTAITFFEFKGRKRYYGDRTETYDEKNITKIFGKQFFYKETERNYFDYKNKYSVNKEENCPTNYKPCGILDSSERTLCLPNDESCPINDFRITSNFIDSNSIEVKDKYNSVNPNVNYYITFSNNNPTGKIITQFKLSQGKPCAKTSENSWIPYYIDEIRGDYSCSTSINGKTRSDIYRQVSEHDVEINIVSLYKDNGLTDTNTVYIRENTVELYAKNYNDVDEKCVEEFLEDYEDEKKYFDSAYKTARALSLIGLILILALFIYIMSTCSYCCNLTYRGIAIAIPIYGIVANIIVISVTNKPKIKYECQKDGTNSDLEDEIDKQYGINTVSIVMAVLNIVFYSIVLMFTICLKFMRNKGIIGSVSVVTPGVPMYPGPYPPSPYAVPYGPKVAYQNVIPASY